MTDKTYALKVIPRAKRSEVIQLDKTSLRVYVIEAPQKGKANAAVIKLLATHFDVPKNQIIILSGHKNSNKTINVDK